MSQLDWPYHFDGRGRTAEADVNGHVRDLIELVLFTAPGERVNRPTFGSGILQLVFAPNGAELAGAVQFLVQGALQQWLSDLILVEAIEVTAEEATLRVLLQYQVRRTGEHRRELFARGGAAS